MIVPYSCNHSNAFDWYVSTSLNSTPPNLAFSLMMTVMDTEVSVGEIDGLSVGSTEGMLVGLSDGIVDGNFEPPRVGREVGWSLGWAEGSLVG